VKTLHIDSWVRLQKEMQAYYADPLEKDRAWNSLNKLQQTGSVKDYSEKFLQLIVKVGKVVNEKCSTMGISLFGDRSRNDDCVHQEPNFGSEIISLLAIF
jgi:Retrotransposon gag protein